MKKHLLFVILLFPFNLIHAQWYLQNSGVTKNLNSVFCITDNKVFVAGDSGTVLGTLDGGMNWTLKTSSTNQKLHSIFFVDSLIGYSVGDSGIVIKTINGGETWSVQNSNLDNPLTSVFFTSKDTGYIVGNLNAFIKTTNGGVNWERDSTFYPCCAFLGSISFISPGHGYILGNDMAGTMVISTIDTARTWNIELDPDAQSNNWWPGISMAVGQTGLTVISGFQGSIRNGWGNWGTWGASSVGNADLNSICYNHNNGNYTAVGTNGIIGLYPNMGPTTCNQNSGVTSDLNDVTFFNNLVGYIAGDNGVILKTLNGGVTSIKESTNKSKTFSIYPNPFSTTTTIKSAEIFNNATLIIYNSIGQQVKEIKNISGNSITLEKDNLVAGIYFFQLIQNSKIIASDKLLITDN